MGVQRKGCRTMAIEIVQQSTEILAGYGDIPISFSVDSRYHVHAIDGGLGGWKLTEEPVQLPYVKDYDAEKDDRAESWSRRWDISNWALFEALDDGVPVGGAVVARDTPGVYMLEGRPDLAVLWDIRIRPDYRRRGIGSRLFRRAAEWGRGKGCRQLKIETQNINVAACKFYASQGCYLGAIHPGIYESLPEEVQLLWYMNL